MLLACQMRNKLHAGQSYGNDRTTKTVILSKFESRLMLNLFSGWTNIALEGKKWKWTWEKLKEGSGE